MDVYLSEKEQIQKIKDWWKKYGTTLLVCLAIFAGGTFGWRYWQQYKVKRAEQASNLYMQMLSADLAHQTNNVQLYAQHLMADYSSTPYASFAALTLARENVNANDLKSAKGNLYWVVDHSGNKSLRQIAKIREARVLLALNQSQQALDLLNKVDDKAYGALIAETRGDIFLSLGNKTKALQQYQAALKSDNKTGMNVVIVAMKVNLLTPGS